MFSISQDAQARFQVLDQPYALPNACAYCNVAYGDHGDRKFIDSGNELEFYGVIYICSMCFMEIAKAFRYLSPEQYTHLADENVKLELQNRELKDENDALRGTISTLANHRCWEPTALAHVKDDEESGGERNVPEEPSEPGSDPSEHANEPVSSEGLPDVRRDAKPKRTKSASDDEFLSDIGIQSSP